MVAGGASMLATRLPGIEASIEEACDQPAKLTIDNGDNGGRMVGPTSEVVIPWAAQYLLDVSAKP